ncbi:MAG: glycosyltransferase family 2 protein [Clostridia bacterium]|jgi:glycosyltransferase involved in cell wall biosynthesis|nr:glycosyltransferase family 2 protein [Clostridiales bacterium]
MKQQVTVLIPAYNEAEYITRTIYGVKFSGVADRILVVDDGSTDKTAEAAREAGADVIRLSVNRGKGNALNEGLSKVHSGVVVFVDADTGQSASELYKLVKPVLAGEADMTIGILPPSSVKGGFGFVKKLARALVKKSTGIELDAGLSGQRAVRREVLSGIGPVPEGFATEVGLNIKALNLGYRVVEVPVNMYHRESGRNLRGFLHRGKQFCDILKYCLSEARDNRLW